MLWLQGGVRVHLDSNDDSYFNPSAGNFGIGTSSPLGLFHVSSSAATFIINGTSGFVGIGTTSPQNTLNVVGDANITGTVEAAAITATGTVTANPFSGAGTDLTGTAASLTAGTATVATTGDSATAFFSTGTIEDARIASTIARDSELAAVIPSGFIGMFNSSCPSGWTYLSAMAGKFARGSTTYGGTGGSDTHTHTTSGTAASTGSASGTTAADGTGATGALGTGAVTGSTAAEGTGATGAASATALTGSISSHTVTNNQVTSDGASATALTGGIDSGANVPAYVNVVFCLKD